GLGRRGVDEAAPEHLEHALLLAWRQGVGRGGTRPWGPEPFRLERPVVRGPGTTHGRTGRSCPCEGLHLRKCLVDHRCCLFSSSLSASSRPKSSDAFPWISTTSLVFASSASARSARLP